MLSPAEIIYLAKKGRIREHLKDIVKLTFYFLVLKEAIRIELKPIKKAHLNEKDSDFFICLNKDNLKALVISKHEQRILDFLGEINQDWISLEQFWDAIASMLSDKFRLFSKEHRIENYIKQDLLKKNILRRKQIKFFNIVIYQRIIVTPDVINSFKTIFKIRKLNDYPSIMRLTGIVYGDFFFTETYVEMNNSIDFYIERFLLRKGGWVVAGMALLSNNYPEPILSE